MARHKLDAVLLAEYDIGSDAEATIVALSQEVAFRRIEQTRCRKIAAFFGSRIVEIEPHSEDDRYFVYALSGDIAGNDLLLASLHLPAPIGVETADTVAEAQVVAGVLHRWIEKVGHGRVIVAGDFNLDPYSPGLCQHQSFNAVMTRHTASRVSRRHHGRDYPLLYNPMWECFGDSTPGPPGTYRHAHEWHILDQILVGPELLRYLPSRGVSILETDGVQSLLATGPRPSDHLPVLLTLKKQED